MAQTEMVTTDVLRDSNGNVLSVPATLLYQMDEAEHCLIANGKMYTMRDGSGADSEWIGVKKVPKQVMVHNARNVNASLDDQGFMLYDAPTAVAREGFDDIYTILQDYYAECAAVVKKVTGASFVAAFDHNVRSLTGNKAGKHVKGGGAQLTPINTVHGDYTITGSPKRLEQLAQLPGHNDEFRKVRSTPLIPADVLETARKGHFSIVNLWRNILPYPLEKQPLAVCDARSVRPEDLCVFEVHYADRVGENYFATHSAEHRWYYYPRMTPSEALLFKQWDSRGTLVGGSNATMALHSAFKDPTASEDAPDRESIEVRCICIFDPSDDTHGIHASKL